MEFLQKIIGESKTAKKLFNKVRKLKKNPRDVLIMGEEGAGRTTVAQYIYSQLSKSKKDPLIIINPTSQTDEELRYILTSHREKKKVGFFGKNVSELSPGATLLIENIERVNFLNQHLIATFLGKDQKALKTRVIMTTNTSFEKLQQERKILPSLVLTMKEFHHITIPALRERTEDIPHLVNYFISQRTKELGLQNIAVDVNTLDLLVKHEWRWNIRELKSVIDNSLYNTEGNTLVLAPEFMDELGNIKKAIQNIEEQKTISLDNAIDTIEKLLILRALKQVTYNQSKAAALLSMNEANLRYKMKKYRIPASRVRA